MKALTGVLLLCSPAAFAQDFGDLDLRAEVRGCHETAKDFEGKSMCIGEASTRCMDETDGGYSTLGMSTCTHAETEAWDVILNEEYGKTMAVFRELDTEEAEYFPNFASREETMLVAQRAWLTCRAAECGNEYALFGSGSMRHIVGAACLLDFTAERTIEIWAKREMY